MGIHAALPRRIDDIVLFLRFISVGLHGDTFAELPISIVAHIILLMKRYS